MYNQLRHMSRGGALPTVMVFLIAIGIYATTMPQVAGAVALRQLDNYKDSVSYTGALSGLQLAKSKMYYDTVAQFKAYCATSLILPLAYQTINNCAITTWVEDNELNLDGTTNSRENGVLNIDTDLHMYIVARSSFGSGADIRTTELMQEVSVKDMTLYNFASSNFDGGAGSGLGPRSWYGDVFMTSPTNRLWNFYYEQQFHGHLTSLNFTSNQALNSFWGPTDPANPLSPEINLGVSGSAAVNARGIHTRYADYASMPAIPQVASVSAQLSVGGEIYNGANARGLVFNAANSQKEVFLHPNGQIWTRAYGADAAAWQPMRDSSNNIVSQDGATVVFNDTIILSGFVTGRLTIGTTKSVILNGNVRNMDWQTSHLGLVAQDAVHFENRKVVNSSGAVDSTGTQYITEPRDTSGSRGNEAGAVVTAATNDSGTNTGQAFTSKNFIAKTPFSAANWTSMSGNDATAMAALGMTDLTAYQQIVKPTLTMMQQDNGTSSQIGHMPRVGAMVDASMVSGFMIGPAITHFASSTYRYDMHGGSFTVHGTYSMAATIDVMATWSSGGGMMRYDLHPFQQATAPDYFMPVQKTYPKVIFGASKVRQAP